MKPIKGGIVLLVFVSIYLFILLPLTPVWAQGPGFPEDADRFSPVAPAPVQEKTDEFVSEEKAPVVKETAPVLTDEVFTTKKEPFALRTRKNLEKPWYKKWWVWTIVAVVVGGAAAAGGGGGGNNPSAGTATGAASFSGVAP